MPIEIGQHWVQCAVCGFKRYRREVRRNYRGWLVCKDTCWEPRHPQEYLVCPKPDRQAVRDAQPPQDPPTFIDPSVRPDPDAF